MKAEAAARMEEKADGYHDESGARIRLDTRHLAWCAENSPEGRNASRMAERDKAAARAAGALRGAACVFCAVFAFRHVGVVFRSGSEMIEMIGVIACLGFVASTLAKVMEGKE